MSAALLYASARARATGGVVALLKVIEPPEFAHFAAIGKRMADENREAAEQTLQRFAAETVKMAGRPPVLYVREGKAEDAVRDLLETEGGHFHPGASRRHRVGGARSACLGADGENGRACPRAGDSGARKPDARRDPALGLTLAHGRAGWRVLTGDAGRTIYSPSANVRHSTCAALRRHHIQRVAEDVHPDRADAESSDVEVPAGPRGDAGWHGRFSVARGCRGVAARHPPVLHRGGYGRVPGCRLRDGDQGRGP